MHDYELVIHQMADFPRLMENKCLYGGYLCFYSTWDYIAIFLLYAFKIRSFKKLQNTASDIVYKRMLAILQRILLLTMFYLINMLWPIFFVNILNKFDINGKEIVDYFGIILYSQFMVPYLAYLWAKTHVAAYLHKLSSEL